MNLSELGSRIRSRRERRGLRQADLAGALRVSPQAVSKWERGENAPDVSSLVPLSRLLDVSVEWLLGGTPSERETFEAVVFATSLHGFAARSARESPRALAAWANGIHSTVTEALRQHDGVPVKYVGDGFLGFFSGARMAERAVQAALRARDLVDHPGLHVALHQGEIFLGLLGHPDHAALDILGATVNTTFMMLPHVPGRCPGRIAVTRRVADAEVTGPHFSDRGRIPVGDLEIEILEPRWPDAARSQPVEPRR